MQVSRASPLTKCERETAAIYLYYFVSVLSCGYVLVSSCFAAMLFHHLWLVVYVLIPLYVDLIADLDATIP